MASILFVDDDALTLKLLSQAAQILGHQALLASSAEKALVQAVEEKPDLVITDVRLGGASGLDLLTQLREHPGTAHIPVITLSALQTAEGDALARERGAVASLPKPVRLQTLLEVIGEYTQVQH